MEKEFAVSALRLMLNLCQLNKKRQEIALNTEPLQILRQLANFPRWSQRIVDLVLEIVFVFKTTSMQARTQLLSYDFLPIVMNLIRDSRWFSRALEILNLWFV